MVCHITAKGKNDFIVLVVGFNKRGKYGEKYVFWGRYYQNCCCCGKGIINSLGGQGEKKG